MTHAKMYSKEIKVQFLLDISGLKCKIYKGLNNLSLFLNLHLFSKTYKNTPFEYYFLMLPECG